MLLTGGWARAEDDVPCPALPLQVDVEPTAWDEALARRITEKLFSELRPRSSCTGDNAARAASVRVAVRWTEPSARARILVELRTPTKCLQALRELDVDRVPEGGLPLAMAIAADELLGALREQAAREPEPPPRPLLDIVIVPAPPPAPAPRPRVDRFGVGARVVIDAFTSGLVLSGADTVAEIAVAPMVDVGVRFGPRAVLAASWPEREGTRLRSAFVAAGFGRLGLSRQKDAIGLASTLEVRACPSYTSAPSDDQ